MTAAVDFKRCRGRLHRTIRDSFVDGLKLIALEIDGCRDASEWIGNAKNEIEWHDIVNKGENHERGQSEGEAQIVLEPSVPEPERHFP